MGTVIKYKKMQFTSIFGFFLVYLSASQGVLEHFIKFTKN
jgi:hypothetical protein